MPDGLWSPLNHHCVPLWPLGLVQSCREGGGPRAGQAAVKKAQALSPACSSSQKTVFEDPAIRPGSDSTNFSHSN